MYMQYLFLQQVQKPLHSETEKIMQSLVMYRLPRRDDIIISRFHPPTVSTYGPFGVEVPLNTKQ